MASPLLRIGARGSPLSLTQTELVRARLAATLGVAIEAITITPIVTSGDKQQEGRLIETGGKGLFTKELDEALLVLRGGVARVAGLQLDLRHGEVDGSWVAVLG